VSGQDNEALKRELAGIIKGIFDAFERHDTGHTETVMTEETTIWDVFQPQLIKGPAERNKFRQVDQAQMQARGKLTLTYDAPVVDVWGDAAIARYYLNFEYQPPNATKGQVRITDVFRKVDGKWKIVHHHEGMVPAGIPPITEKKQG
jgi:ketosteroid isomerase-like protein